MYRCQTVNDNWSIACREKWRCWFKPQINTSISQIYTSISISMIWTGDTLLTTNEQSCRLHQYQARGSITGIGLMYTHTHPHTYTLRGLTGEIQFDTDGVNDADNRNTNADSSTLSNLLNLAADIFCCCCWTTIFAPSPVATVFTVLWQFLSSR